jgi:hypothetical protein
MFADSSCTSKVLKDKVNQQKVNKSKFLDGKMQLFNLSAQYLNQTIIIMKIRNNSSNYLTVTGALLQRLFLARKIKFTAGVSFVQRQIMMSSNFSIDI